mgnify:FL=1
MKGESTVCRIGMEYTQWFIAMGVLMWAMRFEELWQGERYHLATGGSWLFTIGEIEEMFEMELDIESIFTPDYARMIEMQLEEQGFETVDDSEIPDSVKRLMFGEVTAC